LLLDEPKAKTMVPISKCGKRMQVEEEKRDVNRLLGVWASVVAA